MNILILWLVAIAVEPPQIFAPTGVHSEAAKIFVETTTEKPWLVMFTATWCGPCQNWKRSSKPRAISSAGFQIVYVDIDQQPKWKTAGKKLPAVDRYPTFWLVDPLTKLPVKVWTGDVSVQEIQQQLDGSGGDRLKTDVRRSRRTKSDIESWVRKNYSQSDNLKSDVFPRNNVWNHLTDGSGGTHVFVSEQISGLELWIALALHDAVHTGRLTPFVD